MAPHDVIFLMILAIGTAFEAATWIRQRPAPRTGGLEGWAGERAPPRAGLPG